MEPNNTNPFTKIKRSNCNKQLNVINNINHCDKIIKKCDISYDDIFNSQYINCEYNFNND